MFALYSSLIIRILVLLGSAGMTSSIAALILTFTQTSGFSQLARLFMLLGGPAALNLKQEGVMVPGVYRPTDGEERCRGVPGVRGTAPRGLTFDAGSSMHPLSRNPRRAVPGTNFPTHFVS